MARMEQIEATICEYDGGASPARALHDRRKFSAFEEFTAGLLIVHNRPQHAFWRIKRVVLDVTSGERGVST